MPIPLTIEDLKKHLGPGLGLRKAKYMIEIPVPGQNGKTLNILCRSTAFPERNIGTVAVFNKGRKYNMRSETAYPGTYNISIIDDSDMSLRWMFDGWLNLVDNSRPDGNFVKGQKKTQNKSKTSYESEPIFSLGNFGEGGDDRYQADVNVWQLGNRGEKVYGYKLQNAFPSSVGIVELDDSDEATLSEFSVTFTYSETIPLKPDAINPNEFNSSVPNRPYTEFDKINPNKYRDDIRSIDLEKNAVGNLSTSFPTVDNSYPETSSPGVNSSPDFGMNNSFIPRGSNTPNTPNISNSISNIPNTPNVSSSIPNVSNLGRVITPPRFSTNFSNPLQPYVPSTSMGRNITNFSAVNPLSNSSSIIKNLAHKVVDGIIDNV